MQKKTLNTFRSGLNYVLNLKELREQNVSMEKIIELSKLNYNEQSHAVNEVLYEEQSLYEIVDKSVNNFTVNVFTGLLNSTEGILKSIDFGDWFLEDWEKGGLGRLGEDVTDNFMQEILMDPDDTHNMRNGAYLANTVAKLGTIVGKMIPYIIILLILIWIVKKVFGGKK